MTQTNEELKTKLYKIMSKDLVLSAKTHIEVMNAINEIMSLIPQHEQLEVKIKQTTLGVHVYEAVYYGRVVMKIFETKQEALDFCKRFNLKVVNEEKE